jgi:hypothetical protein
MKLITIDGINIDVLLGKYILNSDQWTNSLDQDSIADVLKDRYYKKLTRKINNIPNKDTFIEANIDHFFEEHPVWDYFFKIDFDTILDQELPDYIKSFKEELVTMTNHIIGDVKIAKWYMSSYGSVLELKLTCKDSIYKIAADTIRNDAQLFQSVIKGKVFSRKSYKDAESFIKGWTDNEITNEEYIEQFINLLFAIRRFEITEFYQDFFIEVMSKVESKIIKLIEPDFEKFFAQLLD